MEETDGEIGGKAVLHHHQSEDVWNTTLQCVAMGTFVFHLQGYVGLGVRPKGHKPELMGGLVTTGSRVWFQTGNAWGEGGIVQPLVSRARSYQTRTAIVITTCFAL